MKYSIKAFIDENKLGKMNFPLGKWNFEPIESSVHTTCIIFGVRKGPAG